MGLVGEHVGDVAIHLLPHLVEAMDRAVVVGVVGMRSRSDLERAGGQSGGIGNAGIGLAVSEAGAASG